MISVKLAGAARTISIKKVSSRLPISEGEVFAGDSKTAKGLVCLPSDNVLHELTLDKAGKTFKVETDPLAGKVTWSVRAGG